MSIEAAIGRIDQILTLQQQILDPSAQSAATSTTSTAAGGPSLAGALDTGGVAVTGGSGSSTPMTAAQQASFASLLASAQAGSSGASDGLVSPYSGSPYSGLSSPYPTGAGYGSTSAGSSPVSASGYVNPLAGASVRAERIDQGVDYAGTGVLGAIGPGVVTSVTRTGSGWEGGGYVEYKLTAGPYAGRSVYYAEGVTPTVTVGQTLAPGQPVATLIPGFPFGIEIGFAAGQGQASYARMYGGGYGEGGLTAAGMAFSNLIGSLGGPRGLTEGRQVEGHFP
jgi:hypothetical protein